MTYDEATTKLQDPNLTPRELSDLHLWMSGEYGRISGELARIKTEKPGRWLTMRSQEGIQSDKQADRLWDMTKDGMTEIEYSLKAKALEKCMSAIKSRLTMMNNEAFNMY